MQIEGIEHKASRTFAETVRTKDLPGDLIDRSRNMLAYLAAIDATDKPGTPPNFGAHPLAGDRLGIWSLTVTRNWRMTFRVNETGGIEGLGLEV